MRTRSQRIPGLRLLSLLMTVLMLAALSPISAAADLPASESDPRVEAPAPHPKKEPVDRVEQRRNERMQRRAESDRLQVEAYEKAGYPTSSLSALSVMTTAAATGSPALYLANHYRVLEPSTPVTEVTTGTAALSVQSLTATDAVSMAPLTTEAAPSSAGLNATVTRNASYSSTNYWYGTVSLQETQGIARTGYLRLEAIDHLGQAVSRSSSYYMSLSASGTSSVTVDLNSSRPIAGVQAKWVPNSASADEPGLYLLNRRFTNGGPGFTHATQSFDVANLSGGASSGYVRLVARDGTGKELARTTSGLITLNSGAVSWDRTLSVSSNPGAAIASLESLWLPASVAPSAGGELQAEMLHVRYSGPGSTSVFAEFDLVNRSGSAVTGALRLAAYAGDGTLLARSLAESVSLPAQTVSPGWDLNLSSAQPIAYFALLFTPSAPPLPSGSVYLLDQTTTSGGPGHQDWSARVDVANLTGAAQSGWIRALGYDSAGAVVGSDLHRLDNISSGTTVFDTVVGVSSDSSPLSRLELQWVPHPASTTTGSLLLFTDETSSGGVGETWWSHRPILMNTGAEQVSGWLRSVAYDSAGQVAGRDSSYWYYSNAGITLDGGGYYQDYHYLSGDRPFSRTEYQWVSDEPVDGPDGLYVLNLWTEYGGPGHWGWEFEADLRNQTAETQSGWFRAIALNAAGKQIGEDSATITMAPGEIQVGRYFYLWTEEPIYEVKLLWVPSAPAGLNPELQMANGWVREGGIGWTYLEYELDLFNQSPAPVEGYVRLIVKDAQGNTVGSDGEYRYLSSGQSSNSIGLYVGATSQPIASYSLEWQENSSGTTGVLTDAGTVAETFPFTLKSSASPPNTVVATAAIPVLTATTTLPVQKSPLPLSTVTTTTFSQPLSPTATQVEVASAGIELTATEDSTGASYTNYWSGYYALTYTGSTPIFGALRMVAYDSNGIEIGRVTRTSLYLTPGQMLSQEYLSLYLPSSAAIASTRWYWVPETASGTGVVVANPSPSIYTSYYSYRYLNFDLYNPTATAQVGALWVLAFDGENREIERYLFDDELRLEPGQYKWSQQVYLSYTVPARFEFRWVPAVTPSPESPGFYALDLSTYKSGSYYYSRFLPFNGTSSRLDGRVWLAGYDEAGNLIRLLEGHTFSLAPGQTGSLVEMSEYASSGVVRTGLVWRTNETSQLGSGLFIIGEEDVYGGPGQTDWTKRVDLVNRTGTDLNGSLRLIAYDAENRKLAQETFSFYNYDYDYEATDWYSSRYLPSGAVRNGLTASVETDLPIARVEYEWHPASRPDLPAGLYLLNPFVQFSQNYDYQYWNGTGDLYNHTGNRLEGWLWAVAYSESGEVLTREFEWIDELDPEETDFGALESDSWYGSKAARVEFYFTPYSPGTKTGTMAVMPSTIYRDESNTEWEVWMHAYNGSDWAIQDRTFYLIGYDSLGREVDRDKASFWLDPGDWDYEYLYVYAPTAIESVRVFWAADDLLPNTPGLYVVNEFRDGYSAADVWDLEFELHNRTGETVKGYLTATAYNAAGAVVATTTSSLSYPWSLDPGETWRYNYLYLDAPSGEVIHRVEYAWTDSYGATVPVLRASTLRPLTTGLGGTALAQYRTYQQNITITVASGSQSFVLHPVDDLGSFDLAGIPEGSYTLTASRLDHVAQSESITIQNGLLTSHPNGLLLMLEYGDFDGDGDIDRTDLETAAALYGSTDARFDINRSGEVDLADLFPLARRVAPATPEP